MMITIQILLISCITYVKKNEIEKVRSILPFIVDINIINKIQNSTGSTCLHVACYYGHRDMVKILLEYGAQHSIRNLRHNLTPFEEAHTDDIKELFLERRKLVSYKDYDYIEWSIAGDNLLEKRREFPQAIDLYKTYDNHHLVSKLLAEVIHYYLNEYLVNQTNDGTHPEDQITRKKIETIETNFKEAIEKQDYLTYFIKAYTLTTFFYRVLNKHLALYVLEYFDRTKDFSSNYRLVNCLVHIVTLIIYHPNLPQYRYKGLCYRGMRITQNDLNQYRLNQHILNRTFLSTSDDRQVAEMFSGEGQQSKMRFTPGNKAKATIPRYNNSVEGWHNAFANRVALNHPNIVKLAEKIRREQSKFEVDMTKILQGHNIKTKKACYRKLDERINRLVNGFDASQLDEFLKNMAANVTL
ncbi:unnamed protein product [Rotaria magnacalcarata]|uniref:Uncharacterized protein n=2 Tax=Rotaria magnacalcarata TaxID=392030 RepID=A0A814L138_9BILA|nr:unnamed protein product [Rotaria magnacalcarata]